MDRGTAPNFTFHEISPLLRVFYCQQEKCEFTRKLLNKSDLIFHWVLFCFCLSRCFLSDTVFCFVFFVFNHCHIIGLFILVYPWCVQGPATLLGSIPRWLRCSWRIGDLPVGKHVKRQKKTSISVLHLSANQEIKLACGEVPGMSPSGPRRALWSRLGPDRENHVTRERMSLPPPVHRLIGSSLVLR